MSAKTHSAAAFLSSPGSPRRARTRARTWCASPVDTCHTCASPMDTCHTCSSKGRAMIGFRLLPSASGDGWMLNGWMVGCSLVLQNNNLRCQMTAASMAGTHAHAHTEQHEPITRQTVDTAGILSSIDHRKLSAEALYHLELQQAGALRVTALIHRGLEPLTTTNGRFIESELAQVIIGVLANERQNKDRHRSEDSRQPPTQEPADPRRSTPAQARRA